MQTNASLTIYNRVPDLKQKRFVYRRHFIPAVHFYTDQKVAVGDAGIKSEDLYKIRIPEESLEGYLTPEEFSRCYVSESAWTADNDDLFVVGECHSDIESIEDLKKQHKLCGIVMSWSDNRQGRQPHIRIGGTA